MSIFDDSRQISDPSLVPYWLQLFTAENDLPVYAVVHGSRDSQSEVVLKNPNWSGDYSNLHTGEFSSLGDVYDLVENYQEMMQKQRRDRERQEKSRKEELEEIRKLIAPRGNAISASFVMDGVEKSEHALESVFPYLRNKIDKTIGMIKEYVPEEHFEAVEEEIQQQRNAGITMQREELEEIGWSTVWADNKMEGWKEGEAADFYGYYFLQGWERVDDLEGWMEILEEIHDNLKASGSAPFMGSKKTKGDGDDYLYDLYMVARYNVPEMIAGAQLQAKEITFNIPDFRYFADAAKENDKLEQRFGVLWDMKFGELEYPITRSIFPEWLYRAFDSEGRLLYVGITSNPWRRMLSHAGRTHSAGQIRQSANPDSIVSVWFQFLDVLTFQPYQDRDSVMIAEKKAILAERPKYNIVHGTYKR